MDTCCNCSSEITDDDFKCDVCNGILCEDCRSWDWTYQLYNDPIGIVRYKGHMVIFNKRE